MGCGGRWWIYFGWWWVMVDGGGYILAGGGWWWVVVNIFWLVVGGGGWWWIYFGWWWVVVDGGGWWHSLVWPIYLSLFFLCFVSVSFCWSSFRMQFTKLSQILIGTTIKSYASLNGAYKRICNICYNICSSIYIIVNYVINNCISDIYIQKWYFIKKWYCIKNFLTAEAFRTFKISFLYVYVIQFRLLEFAVGQIWWL